MKSSRSLLGGGVVMLASFALIHSTEAQIADPTLDVLVRKGVLTAEEAREAQARKAADSDIKVFWKEGLNFQSGDKKFKGKLGGRVQLDVASFSEDDDIRALPDAGGTTVGDIPAGVEFRRVRLALEGEYTASLPSYYKVEIDFAGAGVAFKDVYLGVGALPGIGSVQIGHFKEPIGLELLTSSRYLTFMERSLPIEAFAPERNTGVLIGNHILGERMTWALGGFTDVGDSGNGTIDSNVRVSGRVTGVPFHHEGGGRLLHLGVSGSYIDPNGAVRFRSRPEAHLAPRFVDTRVGTTDIPSDQAWLVGTEAAFICGPFSLQAEYIRTWVDTIAGGTADFDGYYVYGSWFVTGEQRAYRRSNGAFDRIRPRRNLSLTDGGLGAWELAVRYSGLNLSEPGIPGGKLNDVTAGVNWYLNPNMKFQVNYVYAMADRLGLDGKAHVVQTRVHVDF